MTTRKKSASFDWGVWFRSFGVFILGFAGILITFYFTTTFTLQKHEEKFSEIGKKFDAFGNQLKENYENWAKTNKAEIEKAEARAKEERDLRDKMREDFRVTFTGFATTTAGMKVQVDTIGKQLDSLTSKIDSISTVQQQNRVLNERRSQ